MPRPDELLSDLRSVGLEVSLRGDRIAIAPRSKLTRSTIREVRQQRPMLMALLAAEASNGVKVEPPTLTPMQRLEAAQRAKVERLLNSPCCPCSTCRAADIASLLAQQDRWRYF
jgi:hypothetical protein